MERDVIEITGEMVPVVINVKAPVYNPKHTNLNVTIYKGLKVKQYRNLYLVAIKNSKVYFAKSEETANFSINLVAPENAVIAVNYYTGSARNVYYRFDLMFAVKQGANYQAENKGVVINKMDGHHTVSAVNLTELPEPDTNAKAICQAEIYNKFQARPSDFDPVITLYHYWTRVCKISAPGFEPELEIPEQVINVLKVLVGKYGKKVVEEALKRI